VSSHHNEICVHRLCGTQDAVECIACNDSGVAADTAQLGYCFDLLTENTFDLASFDFNQLRGLIIVHDVDQRQIGVIGLSQETGTP
jgi:hypothetical protein